MVVLRRLQRHRRRLQRHRRRLVRLRRSRSRHHRVVRYLHSSRSSQRRVEDRRAPSLHRSRSRRSRRSRRSSSSRRRRRSPQTGLWAKVSELNRWRIC